MKIAVISDTHGRLSADIAEELKQYEYILHCGDFDDQGTYEKLAALGPTLAGVRGNCDWWAYGDFLPPYRLIRFKNTCIFMTHRPQDVSRYQNREHDIVLCGHTHRYEDNVIGGTRYLNPGSISEPRDGARGYLSLEIDEYGVRVEHLFPGQKISSAKQGMSSKGVLRSTDMVNITNLCECGVSDAADIIRNVMKLTDKGKEIRVISAKLSLSEELAERIVRLYLTHPGIDADGILNKMGV